MLSYEAFERRQQHIAGMLRSAGLHERDRIALLCGNRREVVELCVAALRVGIVPVPINPLFTQREYVHILRDCGARWLFTDRVVTTDTGRVTNIDDLNAVLDVAAPYGELAATTRGRPMHYTSGTTGVPKGVWLSPPATCEALRTSQRFRSLWGITAGDVHLVCSPLAHSAPLRFSIRTLEAGGTVVVQERFDAAATVAAVETFRVTTTFMVPTHLERILNLERLEAARVASLRLLAHAGAPIRPSTKRAAIKLFPDDSVWEFYGSTEGQVTRISAREWLHQPGSVGRGLPDVEILVTDEGGSRLGAGEVGEIWVRAPDTERFEYWNDPVKTEQAWRDGAFTVGDLGYLDEQGYLFLVGRKFDTIITGGVNVYPQEVEAVLNSHRAVADAVVYGVDDSEWGQQVHAAVVTRGDGDLDPDALRAWLTEHLASYKCPRVIHVVSQLDRTPTGKIVRRPPKGVRSEQRER